MDKLDRIKSALEKSIKPELNHIFTERPFRVNGGLDFGWFCREHALHLYLLGELLGLKSNIVLGDIFIKNGEHFYTTYCTNCDHAWCTIDGIAPLDISMSFKYFDGMPDVSMIYNKDESFSRPYVIKSLKCYDKGVINEWLVEYASILIFIPLDTINLRSCDLINDPYTFLLNPPDGYPKYTEIHGADIFNMITMHCYKLIMGEAKPLYKHYTDDEALNRIKKWNPSAKKDVYRLLNR